jgi:glycine/D-amino acid oxidase-like deaminating enzyme
MLTSRRELIASFLGIAVADLACRRNLAQAPIPGGFADTSIVETGHLLRAGPPPLASEVERTVEVLIVGGGAAGLSAAWRLAGAGVTDVMVCELDSVEGGTARSGKNAVSAFPWGAHYLPAPLTLAGPVPRLLREMGVLTGVDANGSPQYAEEALIHEPEERIFYRGSWYEGLYLRAGASAEDLAQLKRFDAQMQAFASARDGKGRKAFAVPVASGSDDAEWTQLDKLSMAQWLELQRFDSPRLEWLVEYACLDDFGSTAADTSAWAGIWYFCSRQTGDEKNDGYLSWPEGNGRLISQLARAAPADRLRRGFIVHTLAPAESGWAAHGLDAVTRKPVQLRARQVVLACPRHVAARVIASWRQAPPAFVKEFQTSPWVVANLTLSARPGGRGFPLAWDNVFYESKSIGYVVATHQSLRADAHGPTVLTWYCPLSGSDAIAERTRLLGTSYSEWEQVVAADLAPAHKDIRTLATRLDVMRWGHAMVKPRPGFVWGGARQQALVSLQGSLHFAHTDLGGLALFEEANHFGVLAAERAIAGLGKSFDSWL